jgi:DHA2 family multidrug resistance protein
VRNFGSSLYISITVVLLVRSTTANYARMTEFVNPFNRTLAFPDCRERGAWTRRAACCGWPARSSIRRR